MLNLAEMDPMQRQIVMSVRAATLRRERKRGGLAVLVSVCWTVAVIVVVAVLAGCAAPTPWGYGRDQAGNVFPEDCRQDLSWVQVPVFRQPREKLNEAYAARGGMMRRGDSVNGIYIEVGTAAFIMIADDLSGWRYDDTLHHERCHAIVGDWHK